MTRQQHSRPSCPHVKEVILDLRDCYTWSFPEFLPFCAQLYYFSSLKNFNSSTCA